MDSALFYITTSLHTLVYIFFIIAPFKNKFRFSTLKTIAILCIYIAITLIIFKLGYNKNHFLPTLPLNLLLLWIAITIGACFLCIKSNPLELLFSLLVIFNMQSYVVICSKAIRTLIFTNTPPDWYFESFRFLFGTIVFVVIFVPAMWFLFMNLLSKVVNLKIDFRYWKYLWIVPFLFYIGTNVSHYWGIGPNEEFIINDIVVLFVMQSFSYATYILCFRMLIKTHESLTITQKAQIMEKQLTIQKNEYLRLSQSISDNQHRLHDWRHHIMVISGFVKEKNYDKLNRYLNEYMSKELSKDEVPLCAHHAVNILLKHFTELAKEEGVDVKCDAIIPEDINVPDADLCIIFGNILENAIDACRACNKKEKILSIKVNTTGKQLIIMIQNTFDGRLMLKDGLYYSTKHDGEGIGFSSIKSIVGKCNGSLKIKSENQVFKVNILLNF